LHHHPVELSWSGSLIRPTNCVHELVNVYLSPSPKPRLSCSRPVQRGGASRGVTEVGQSESWPEGQPEGRCGARGHASQAWTRGALGNRPGPIRGSAFNGWTRQVKGGETCLDGELARACARKNRSQGRRSRRGGTLRGVAVCLCFSAIREISRGRYQGAPFGVPSPLNVEGRSTKSPTRAAAREREAVAV
jgi:hypothetical protein